MSLDFEDVIRILPDSLSRLSSDNDLGNRLQIEIGNRDKYYTDLLKSYVTISKWRNVLKEVHKWLFFWLIVAAGVICICFSVKVLNWILSKNDIKLMTNSLPAIITAILSLVSTVIVIPITITKFLFNTKEDDNITTIIQHTQEHDAAGMNLLKKRFIEKESKDTNTAASGATTADSDID